MDYVLKRLVSGLSSNTTRVRSYACLRELIESITIIDPFRLLTLADESVQDSQGSSKKDRGEHNLLRVLASSLCIESASDFTSATVDDWKRLVATLFDVLDKKKFVSDHAAEFLLKLVNLSPFGSNEEEVYDFFLEKISKQVEKSDLTFDVGYLSLVIASKGYESTALSIIFEDKFNAVKPVSNESWPTLVELLMKTSGTFPRIHPYVEPLASFLVENGHHLAFWEEMKKKLTAGRNEICLALKFLTLLLPHLTKAAHFKSVFTPDVLAKIIEIARLEVVSAKIERAKEERLITGKYKPVHALMTALVKRFSGGEKPSDKMRNAVVKMLTTSPGSLEIDRILGGSQAPSVQRVTLIHFSLHQLSAFMPFLRS